MERELQSYIANDMGKKSVNMLKSDFCWSKKQLSDDLSDSIQMLYDLKRYDLESCDWRDKILTLPEKRITRAFWNRVSGSINYPLGNYQISMLSEASSPLFTYLTIISRPFIIPDSIRYSETCPTLVRDREDVIKLDAGMEKVESSVGEVRQGKYLRERSLYNRIRAVFSEFNIIL